MMIATATSTDGSKTYTIRQVGDQMICSCSDHLYRSNGEPYLCKHLAELTAKMLAFATKARKSKSAEKVLTGE